MKRITFPTCGTCDLTSGKSPNLFCHGGPPSAWQGPKIDTSTGAPVTVQATWSQYPPRGPDTLGCAMHPKVRGKLGRGM